MDDRPDEGDRTGGAAPEPPPSAPRSPLVTAVRVRGRRPAAPNGREVSLLYAENGRRLRRVLRVGRPTAFEEVVVATVEETSAPPVRPDPWPATPREAARLAYRRLRAARAALSPLLRDARPMYDVRAVEPNNMAHLLLEILPLCLFARESIEEGVRCVFRDVRGPFRELLDVLGIDALFTTRTLAGGMVRVRGTRGLAAYDLLDIFDCPSVTLLPHVYERFAFTGSRRVEKAFFARRGARALLNHAEVERMLAARGYETVFMEDHPVPEQLALAAQVRQVVGVHGAALSTLIVNRGLRSVVELLPPHVYHQYFAVCLERRVERYVLLMPEFDQAVVHSGWPALLFYKNAPFAADLVALERALDEADG